MRDQYQKQLQKMMNAKTNIKLESKSNNESSLYIYGSIGGWWGDNDAQSILRQLKETKADKIHVHINSPGGSAFDGIAISNLLKKHAAEIIIHIDGWAASAASIIAMAGDRIIMPSNTMMMIHRASTYAYGNASDFEKAATDLRKIDTAVTATYENRFVGERDELVRLLEEETFLTANEAVALGLADEVANEIEIQDIEEDEKANEKDYEDYKEALMTKYAAKLTKEPTQKTVKPKQNLNKLFLNL